MFSKTKLFLTIGLSLLLLLIAFSGYRINALSRQQVLILTFSVFFPLGKLISSGLYLLRESSRKNKFVHFFAFKSGKWSMADVMVVAIMLTYIGMNSMLTSQLAVLNIKEDNITSIATNNTSLQPGYMVFVLFVVFALILSEILHRITKKIAEISS